MTHLLDTHVCVSLIRRRPLKIRRKLETFQLGDLGISAITESELRPGAEKSSSPAKNHAAIDRLSLTLPTVPFDALAAGHYGAIRADLERAGKIIGSMDLLIAAHARSRRWILVTNNTREFRRVRGLQLENWMQLEQFPLALPPASITLAPCR